MISISTNDGQVLIDPEEIAALRQATVANIPRILVRFRGGGYSDDYKFKDDKQRGVAWSKLVEVLSPDDGKGF
jgi:hypothetical protein